MSGSGYACDERGWRTDRPMCLCSAGSDAPFSEHYSRRFDGESGMLDCPLYLWHHGCSGVVAAYGCPIPGCSFVAALCASHATYGGEGDRLRVRIERHVAGTHPAGVKP